MVYTFDVLLRSITFGLQFDLVDKCTIVPQMLEDIMKTSYQGQVYYFKSFEELWHFYSEKLHSIKR